MNLPTTATPVKDEATSFARVVLLTVVPAYVLIILVGIVGFYIISDEADTRTQGDRNILVARTIATCDERNVTKEALRGTIDAALAGEGIGDLTLLPSYRDLDETTQRFVREIVESTRDAPSSRATLLAFKDTLTDEDCEKIGADLRRDLEREDHI